MPSSRVRTRTTLCTLVLLGHCCLPAAQTVYRCGNAYADTPCAGAHPVKVDDPRTAAQQEQSQRATQLNARLAREMAQRRLHEDHNAPHAPRTAKAGQTTTHPKTPIRHADAAPAPTAVVPRTTRGHSAAKGNFVAQSAPGAQSGRHTPRHPDKAARHAAPRKTARRATAGSPDER